MTRLSQVPLVLERSGQLKPQLYVAVAIRCLATYCQFFAESRTDFVCSTNDWQICMLRSHSNCLWMGESLYALLGKWLVGERVATVYHFHEVVCSLRWPRAHRNKSSVHQCCLDWIDTSQPFTRPSSEIHFGLLIENTCLRGETSKLETDHRPLHCEDWRCEINSEMRNHPGSSHRRSLYRVFLALE